MTDIERIRREARSGSVGAIKALARVMSRSGYNHALDITHGLIERQKDLSKVQDDFAGLICEQVVELDGGDEPYWFEIPTFWYVSSVLPLDGNQISVRVRDLREHKDYDPIFLNDTTAFELKLRYYGIQQHSIEAFYALLLHSPHGPQDVRITLKLALP